MKKLPIGIQTFQQIREENFCYVDKTELISRLVEEGKYYFLSRPRRFGKSLLIDTIAEAFAGNRKLFTGLYLENNWDWKKKSPVVRLDYSGGIVQSRERLDEKTNQRLDDQALEYSLKLTRNDPADRLDELIRGISEVTSQKVVVLVDEYDKPILDNITDTAVARELREGLKNIYSVIKSQDAHVKFAFLTGVSKFSKVSLFSGLNNLKDITMDKRFACICGYTEEDLDTVFSEHLQGVDRSELQRWYNGYNFLGERVYNPFDVLLYLDSREFSNYWFESGTPGFLIDLLRTRHFLIPEMEQLEAGEELLGSFDIDCIQPETLLFQAGYVTIQKRIRQGMRYKYYLSYPNLEVKMSLTGAVLNAYTLNLQKKERLQSSLYIALEQNNLDRLGDIFHAFFASIPHDWYRKNALSDYEGYYASIVYCYFAALGLDVSPEDTTNHGRIDLSIRFADRVYLLEFKVNELTGSGQALAQLKEKKYHEKYQGKEIYLIGIEFSKADRNITRFEWEKVDS